MGIEIKVATRLEPLLEALAQDLSKLRGADPLKQPLVVAGTRGMERWVLESIARQNGSIAHVEMAFPEKLMQMIALPKAAVDGTNLLRRATWKRERLRWEVLQELRAPHAAKEFDALLKLLSRGAAGDAGEVGRNWVAMATRLADGMERMVYYRPAWVAAFRAGEVPAELADWRREREEGEGVSGWSEAYARLIQKLLARRGPLVQEWIEEASAHRGPIALSRFGATKCSVHLFANSAPSPIMLRALRTISQSKPVILYVLEPTEAFLDPKLVRRKGFARVLSEEQYSHPMLFGGGQQTLELRALLEQEFADAQEQREPEMPVVFEEQGASLLRLVQERLAQGVPRGEAEFSAAEAERDRLREDESILVLKTVDDRRQVEVLRDELLALFARGGVAPDEVVVMSPRLAEFAPLIRQVFSGVGLAPAAGTVPTIPYVMVSDAGGEQRPIAAALSLLLEAASGRFDATFCHRWLTLSAVMQAWGLPDDISELSTAWFASSNARWGLDEDDRQSRVDNIGGRMGMEAGIERMALGLLTGERPESLTERAPAEVAGGIQTRDLAAAVRSLDAVAGAVRVFRDGHGGRPVSAWVESVRGWLGSWFGGWKFAEERYAVERVMDALAEQSTEAASVEITAAAFAEVLQAELEQVRNTERKQGAGVTFCSLVPMRAIPFKVVVLMGLEAAAFPRKRDDDRLQPLVHLQKGVHARPCDPDASREDRHLFLEAFGMARDRFWVIANGFEGKSGEPLAESAPVLELMECVRLVRGETSNRTDSPRVTAARALLPAAVTYRSHTDVEEREAPAEVEPAPVEPKLPLSELLKAIMEPLRLFATKVLRVPLEDEETVTSDDPNGIDYLEQLKVCKVRVGVVTNPDKHASVSVDSAAEGGAAIADIDKLEADYAAAGAVAKGYLGLGAVDALRGRLASLEHELRRLEVFERSWKELGGAAVGELDGSEETPPISIASDGVVSLIQPGPLLWSGSVCMPVVVSHSKQEKAAFEAIVTLALVRLASEQAPPVGLRYLWWDAKNESYKVGICVWPEGLDAEGWLRELIRFRREAMQRLVLASRELLFGAVSSSKNIADGSWPEVLQRSLADVDPGLVARVGCLGWFFDLLRADPPAVKVRPAGVPAVQEGEQAEGERSAEDDAAGYLVDRVSSEVVKAVADSKGYDFPAGLMRDSVRAPYPRRAGSTKQPNWSATLHGDVAWWTAVVGLPVVFSAYAVHNGKAWAGKRTPHQSVPATAVAAAPGQGSIATKEDA
jgi:exodeoxyribonuclease V gamma subunit